MVEAICYGIYNAGNSAQAEKRSEPEPVRDAPPGPASEQTDDQIGCRKEERVLLGCWIGRNVGDGRIALAASAVTAYLEGGLIDRAIYIRAAAAAGCHRAGPAEGSGWLSGQQAGLGKGRA